MSNSLEYGLTDNTAILRLRHLYGTLAVMFYKTCRETMGIYPAYLTVVYRFND